MQIQIKQITILNANLYECVYFKVCQKNTYMN